MKEIISRRNFLATTGAAVPALSLRMNGFSRNAQKLNIIWLIADDAGWKDFGCYGHPTIKTPNIDRLATNGIRFTRAFVTSPQCSPSRSSVWTGKYAHTMGTEDLHAPLPAAQTILPELLHKKDYFCGNVGKLHLGKAAEKKFDFLDKDIHAWEKFFRNRPANKPFFLTLGFYDPHRPYKANAIAQPHKSKDVIVPPYLPDNEETRKDIALYYDEISRMDSEIGSLLQYLSKNSLEEKTIIFFWSDNGSPFPRAKGTLYDAGIATPLIVQWKGTLLPGLRHQLTSCLDLAPTILDLVGLKPPEDMQGKSMLPVIRSAEAAGRDYIFAERNWHDIDDHCRTVRSKRFKYIRNYYPREPFAIPADVVRSITFQKMRQLRDTGQLTKNQMLIFRWPRPKEELYDLASDSWEFNNLIYDPAYQDVLKEMRLQLDRWITETNDISPQKRKPNLYDYETGKKLKDK